MASKVKGSQTSPLHSYAHGLQERALIDLAKMSSDERGDAVQKLMLALDCPTPLREQVFVESIVQEIKSRRKKSCVAA